MNILVCVKQVPDTTMIKIDPVKHTLIREGVPAILNPFDGYALEAAARIKDKNPGTKITVVTMGPPQAKAVLKECIGIAADKGYLVTGRTFGGSDTLATSYILSHAIKKIEETEGKFDAIFCGKQAIDGDTAQVGPQVAEKLGLPQVTYAEELVAINDTEIIIKRRLERGTEVVVSPLPALITVNSSAKECRPRNAKRVMKFKYALATSEMAVAEDKSKAFIEERPYLHIVEFAAADVNPDPEQLGLSGSPTKVKKIENVVFQAKEAKALTADDADINSLMVELIASHTLG